MTDKSDNLFLNENYRREVWCAINEKIDEKEKVKKMPIKWISYAAAVIIFIITGVTSPFWFTREKNKKDSQAATYARIINPTTRLYKAKMNDGSTITLYPRSEIVFRQPFATKDRHISLKGKALFDVAKNEMLPFQVLSKSITTTAIGTSFTVVSDSLANEVNVYLHEGKVSVQHNNDSLTMVYLAAGDNLSWDLIKETSKQGKLVDNKLAEKRIAKNQSKKVDNFELVYDQEPLTNVMKEISKYYGVLITHKPAQLKRLYFSGTIKSTDEISRVLNRMALLYNLSITKDSKGFRIYKQ